MKSISKDQATALIKAAKKTGNYSDKANYIYSKSALNYRLGLLKDTFPSTTLHAIAIKTNNHPAVLEHIVDAGFGLEAASIEEVQLAINAGIETDKIVFDSPVKTRSEIDFCHSTLSGALINVNCFEEIERYPQNFNCKLGLRINPLIDVHTDKDLNVSKLNSKFGVPITQLNKIYELLEDDLRFTAIHFHIGSGLSDFKPNLKAFDAIINIANKVNASRLSNGKTTLIDTIDIGGGIDFDVENDDLKTFSEELGKRIKLTDLKLVTEYGKFVHEQNAFVSSSVEYITKNTPEVHSAFIHIGADLFLRKIYSSMKIDYPIDVLGSAEKPLQKYRIVGPLCFAGDVLYEAIELPVLQEGDEIIIRNTGANTYSMWSDHCSREKVNFIFI